MYNKTISGPDEYYDILANLNTFPDMLQDEYERTKHVFIKSLSLTDSQIQ